MSSPVEITMTVPGDSRFVAFCRVAAASLAVELDFSVDEIEELRIAVDELVTMLIDASAGTSIDLSYRLTDEGIEVEGRTESSVDLNELVDAISRQILDSVLDGYDLGLGSGSIEKRCRPA